MHFLEKRPYTEITNAKADRTFQGTLGLLYGKNWFVTLKQHWETRGWGAKTQGGL